MFQNFLMIIEKYNNLKNKILVSKIISHMGENLSEYHFINKIYQN